MDAIGKSSWSYTGSASQRYSEWRLLKEPPYSFAKAQQAGSTSHQIPRAWFGSATQLNSLVVHPGPCAYPLRLLAPGHRGRFLGTMTSPDYPAAALGTPRCHCSAATVFSRARARAVRPGPNDHRSLMYRAKRCARRGNITLASQCPDFELYEDGRRHSIKSGRCAMTKEYKVLESPSAAQLEMALNNTQGNWSIEAFHVRETASGATFMVILSTPKPASAGSV